MSRVSAMEQWIQGGASDSHYSKTVRERSHITLAKKGREGLQLANTLNISRIREIPK